VQRAVFVTASVLRGPEPGNGIHVLKAECEFSLPDDDKPDPSPSTYFGLRLCDQPVVLCLLNLPGFRGKKLFVAKLTYSWSEPTLSFSRLLPLCSPVPPNGKTAYANGCGEDNMARKCEYKMFKIIEGVDFSNSRISERPLKLFVSIWAHNSQSYPQDILFNDAQ
jgi:hypothetical protein